MQVGLPVFFSVPLCFTMMYWWFIKPMRCMKSMASGGGASGYAGCLRYMS